MYEMTEGWSGDQYYSLFDNADHSKATKAYDVDRLLPGYTVIGLIGWDDLLLSNNGGYFTCPTVPIVPEHVTPFSAAELPSELETDVQHAGTVKWYVTPLIFGGNPADDSNIVWVDYAKHQELVQWWNAKYAEVRS